MSLFKEGIEYSCLISFVIDSEGGHRFVRDSEKNVDKIKSLKKQDKIFLQNFGILTVKEVRSNKYKWYDKDEGALNLFEDIAVFLEV